MRIKSIESAAFGGLRVEQPMQFRDGLNLIYAPNQAGKSTMLTLIEWLLYGVPPAGRGRNLKEAEAWAPWDGGKPYAVALIEPMADGWPELVRIEVHFDTFDISVSDANTLANCNKLFEVDKQGTWDLGEKLTGLTRGAWRISLHAAQGSMESILSDTELRRLLTHDLAGLVEDPQRATLDQSITELDKPKFTMGGFQDTPIQIDNLVSRARNAVSEARAEREGMEERAKDVEQAVAMREEAQARQRKVQQQIRAIEGAGEHEQLAVAAWRFRRLDKANQAYEQRVEDLTDGPPPALFTNELRSAIERWHGEEEAYQAERRERNSKLERLRSELAEKERYVRTREANKRYIEHLDEAKYTQKRLTEAIAELEKAKDETRELGESSDVEARKRYEKLNEELKPHREYLSEIHEVTMRKKDVDAQLAELNAQKEKLSAAESTGGSGSIKSLVAAMLMIFAAGSGMLGYFEVLPRLEAIPDILSLQTFYPYAIAGILVLAALFLLISALKRTTDARRAEKKLKSDLQPKISELLTEESMLKRARMEMQSKRGLPDTEWSTLTTRIPEFMALKLKLEAYANAYSEQHRIEENIRKIWGGLRHDFLDTPRDVDLQWLKERIRDIENIMQAEKDRADINAKLRDLELDITSKERMNLNRRDELRKNLAPFGLDELAMESPQEAIDAFRELQKRYSGIDGLRSEIRQAEQHVSALGITREELQQKLSALPPSVRAEIEEGVKDEADLEEMQSRQREVRDRLASLNRELDQLRMEVQRLREEVARSEDSLRLLHITSRKEKEAKEYLAKAERWHRAVELAHGKLSEVRSGMSSNLAPLVSGELAEVLANAPVMGVQDAALSDALELRLRVEGAPPSLSHEDLLARLSSGARRQLALAMRIAVARALSQNHRPLILLDEPLAELDDQRALDCLTYLERLGEHCQVLLTTCHNQQSRWLLEGVGAAAQPISLPR